MAYRIVMRLSLLLHTLQTILETSVVSLQSTDNQSARYSITLSGRIRPFLCRCLRISALSYPNDAFSLVDSIQVVAQKLASFVNVIFTCCPDAIKILSVATSLLRTLKDVPQILLRQQAH